MGQAIVVTSGKGGVGKTTTSANLGTALALLGQRVCMIDTDIGLRNLDVVMGLENRIVYDIVDVIEGRCKMEQALIKDKRFENLYLLPAAQTKDKDDVKPEQVKEIVNRIKELFDFAIIDCPAGIEQGFRNAIAGADRAIVVTTPEKSAVRDADRVIGKLHSERIDEPKLVVNRIRPNMLHSGDMLSIDDICSVLQIDVIGIIPDDDYVIKAANNGEPTVLNPQSKAALAYRNIARRILGDPVPLMSLELTPSFIDRVKKFFKLG